MLIHSSSKIIFTSSLLIAGNCIGAGMLALPIFIGTIGLVPSIAVSFCMCLFMMLTGLFYLQACEWMGKKTHMFSLSDRFLGKTGKIITVITYLFLYYCLLVAYISGIAPMLKDLLPFDIPDNSQFIILALLFSFLILTGKKWIGRTSNMLMCGLILSFFLLIASSKIDTFRLDNLLYQQWNHWYLSIPLLFSAYGYQNIIPTLAANYYKHFSALKVSIIIGTLIPFIFYSIWQCIIVGIVPYDLLEILASEGRPANEILIQATGSVAMQKSTWFFAFFALVTSLLGVGYSTYDFIKDGFRSIHKNIPNALASLLIFLPPALICSYDKNLFLKALRLAGGFGEVILNGLIPTTIIAIGCYKYKLKTNKLLSNRILLSLAIACSLGFLVVETYHLLTSKGGGA